MAEIEKKKLEEFLECEYEIVIEFTGLIRLVATPRISQFLNSVPSVCFESICLFESDLYIPLTFTTEWL